jgi:hypothetical protein
MKEVYTLLEEKFNSLRFEKTLEIKRSGPHLPENYVAVNE